MSAVLIPENSSTHWGLRIGGFALLVAVLWYIPNGLEGAATNRFADSFVLMTAVMGLNLVLGFAGQISIGHSAFYGIGAYSMAILVKDYGWAPHWTFFVGAVVAFAVGAVVALPALRLKGSYLALITLAVAVLFPTLLRWKKIEDFTGGSKGIDSVRYKKLPELPLLGELRGLEGRAKFNYWLALLMLVIAYLVCRGIVRSRAGRALVAIRDNETAAAVMGVNLALTKTMVFGFSASICALAGSLSTLRTGVASPDGLNLTLFGAIVFLVAMVIGGPGTLWGPIIGGGIYFWVDYYTRDWGSDGPLEFLFSWSRTSPSTIIFAVALIGLMFVAPRGIAGFVKQHLPKYIRIVPPPVTAPATPPSSPLPVASH
jgi:branched-chain amino acid transport system permease protein